MRLDLIIRTSQRKADAQSPDQQLQGATACAAMGGHTIVTTHDTGGSESGKSMERAGLESAKQRVRDGLTDGIIVAYLDRLGRAPIEESMGFVRSFLSMGGVLVAADWSPEPIKLEDPNTETMLVFRLQMNRDLWTKAAARYRLSQENAIKRGVWPGKTHFGYSRLKSQPYSVHPTQGQIVTEAFRLGAHQGISRGVGHLVDAGIDRTWARRLLANRIYLGEIHHERGTNLKAHDPLTTVAHWEACQVKPRHRAQAGSYPLSAIARCGCCGLPLNGGRKTVRGRGYKHYRVERRGQRTGGHASISAVALDTTIREMVKAAYPAVSLRFGSETVDIDGARADLHEAETELQALSCDMRARKAMGAANWVRALESAREDVTEAQEAYRGALARASQIRTLPPADALDDDDSLRIALDVLVEAVHVKPGRGPIAERISVQWRNADGLTRTA